MYRIEYLRKENLLNKVLKYHKATKEPFSVLFVSLWDPRSKALMSILEKKLSKNTSESYPPLYIVDSFNMPHSFVIFKVKTVPYLVVAKEQRKDKRIDLSLEGYLPKILEHFGISRFIIPESDP